MTAVSEKSGYKWVMAALCFLTFSVTIGFFYNTLSLFLKPVTEALGIPRSLYAASTLTSTAASVVIGMFFGKIVARVRTRLLVLTAVTGVILATLLYAFARNPILLFLFWFMEGTCLFFCSTSMISFIINRWFTEHRGSVLGVVMAGSGVGAAVGAQVLRPIIIGQRAFFGFTGYRAATCVNTMLLTVLLLLLLIFFRDPPAAQIRQSGKKRGVWAGPDWDTVRRSPLLYLIGGCLFLTFVAMHAPVFINAAHLEDVGLEPTYLTNVMSIYAVSLFLCKILMGFGSEKLGVPVALTVCNLASAVSSVCLSLVSSGTPGLALAHAILLGCAIPVETVLLPLIVTELFGETCSAKITGLFFGMMCVGYAAGDLLTNGLFDAVGTYRPILLAYAGIMLCVAVAEPFVFAYGRKKRAEFLREPEAAK